MKKYLTFSNDRFKALRLQSANDTPQLNEEKAGKSKQEDSQTETERDATVEIKSYEKEVTLNQGNSIQNKTLFDILIEQDEELNNLGKQRTQIF